jgi:hypothetical protein
MATHLTTARMAALLLAVALGGAAPATAQVPVRLLVYRNDTGILPVRVQGGSILPNGMPRLAPPHIILPSGRVGLPGATAWDQIVAPGPKLIVITDPQNPNRVYFRGQILFGNQNQFYSIQMAGMGPGRVPMVRLVPIAPPAGMAMPGMATPGMQRR